jgi:hypothetical protein
MAVQVSVVNGLPGARRQRIFVEGCHRCPTLAVTELGWVADLRGGLHTVRSETRATRTSLVIDANAATAGRDGLDLAAGVNSQCRSGTVDRQRDDHADGSGPHRPCAGRWTGRCWREPGEDARGPRSRPHSRPGRQAPRRTGNPTNHHASVDPRRQGPMNPHEPPRTIDPSVAHPARRYNFWLGGKDNFAADRESGERIAAAYPQVIVDARANRDFVNRAITYLAGEMGVAQYLDIGAGLPAEPNVHQLAQDFDPCARVVYVDNDPLVMVHARALLTGTPQGVTAYAEVDMRDPNALLAHPDVKNVLNFTEPIAVVLAAVLHFVDDDEQTYHIVARLVEALPRGSYLLVSHATDDLIDDVTKRAIAQLAGRNKKDGTFRPRSLAQVTRFFDGLALIDPGICLVADWRPDPADTSGKGANVYGALARVDRTTR